MKVEVQAVTQRFAEITALNDLSFTLEGESIVGLLGRNGSGKTTLLSIMAGFRSPTSGRVLIDGEPVFEHADVVRRIALIREGGDTVDETEKVSEALRFAAWFRPNWNADMAGRLLDRFEVSQKSKLDQLSRGKRSAVGIALGLAAQADLTMFDETYLGLDAPSRYVFYDELLQDFMANPRMFVISTHLIEEVSRILEDVVMIDRGALLLHDTAEHIAGQGVAVTGSTGSVARFVSGRRVIGERSLGRTTSSMIYGDLSDADAASATELGLEISPIDLQDLFVHLTTTSGEKS